jgi:hypothetical protein
MNHETTRNKLIILFLCVSWLKVLSAQTARTTPEVRQVDHILVESSDPRALFSFFTETLQLPVAWPVSENQEYVSGGVGTGNVNLELFRYAARKIPEARYSGLAFEPYPLADALRRLQMLAIPYSPPEPYTSTLPNGSQGVAWTTVSLPSFSKPGMSIFLYVYSPVFLKVDVLRKQLGNRLILSNGGPLGLLSVDEILIETTRLKSDRQAWSLLLGKPTGSGSLRAGSGPAIRLVQGSADRIREIIFKVQSLDRAKAFLRKNKALGSVLPTRMCISPARVQGLRISLADN